MMNRRECLKTGARCTAVALALLVGGCVAHGPGKGAPGTVYVDEFDLSGATCGLGMRMQAKKSVGGHALTVDGRTYGRGFGTRPESAVMFRANGKVTAFDAHVAIDDEAKGVAFSNSYGKATARFKVWADGRVVWDSGNVKLGQKPVAAHADLSGAKEIVLETRRRRNRRHAGSSG